MLKKKRTNMVRILFILILLAMLSVSIYIANNSTKIINGKKKISLLAQDGDVTWDISATTSDHVTATLSVDGTLTISGSGKMNNFDYISEQRASTAPWYESRELIKTIKIEEGVTSIGDFMFFGCGNLTSIEIPEGITSIGNAAFLDCTSLTNIEIPAGVTSIGDSAFDCCTSLTNIEIPAGVTSIGDSAFYWCASLTSIKIPESVTNIGEDAFYYCSSLTSIEIPESVTNIGECAFSACSSLTSIEIPQSVTNIGNYTFYYCSSLTSIEIPEGVTSIGDFAFDRCSSLTSIKIPEGVTSIGEGAFYDSGLTSINIHKGVTSIGAEVFSECKNLKSVKLPNSIHSVCKNAFYKCSPLIEIDVDPECGYQLEGWYENEEFTGEKLENLPINSNVNKMLYAKWAPIEYTITYDLAGGSLPQGKSNPTTYTIETENFTLNNPTKTGYAFTGWTGSNGSTKQTQVTILKGSTENKTYTANWKANTYTITYNGNGATGGNTEKSTHEYDKEKALTANGFTNNCIITYNHNYQGSQNETREYNVSFSKWNTKADGTGTNYEDKQVVKNLTTKNGENINLYAQWKNTSGEVIYVPERTGYTFAGWYTNSDLTGDRVDKQKAGSYTPTSSITLYAKWTPTEYTITYNLAGGSMPQGKSNPATYTIETASFTLNNPVKTGYTFAGWTGSNGSTKQTQVTISKGSTGNKEYVANWKANTYTITYNGNGATGGNTAKSTHEYDKEKALTANGFTKGYTITYNHNYQGSQNETRESNIAFSKWNTKADGTGTNYEDKQSVKNLTTKNGENINLYAQWENTNEEVTYVPERTGYTFAGWYTNSELTGERVDKQKAGSYIPTSSITLYAKWSPIEYSITYDLVGGSLPQGKSNPGSYTIETETFTLNNPQKEGYIFTGWTESNSQTPEITVTIEKGSTGNKAYTANWEKKVELQITIDSKYEIKEEDGVKYLTNIEPNTTIEAFLWNQETRKIETNGEIKVYQGNKEIDYLADGVGAPLLGTGYRIEITLEDKKQEYIAVVKGDLTGNGKIDQGDLLMLAKYKVGKLKENAEDETQRITKESILASDLNSNGSNSDQGDLLMIAKILVGKFVN